MISLSVRQRRQMNGQPTEEPERGSCPVIGYSLDLEWQVGPPTSDRWNHTAERVSIERRAPQEGEKAQEANLRQRQEWEGRGQGLLLGWRVHSGMGVRCGGRRRGSASFCCGGGAWSGKAQQGQPAFSLPPIPYHTYAQLLRLGPPPVPVESLNERLKKKKRELFW